MWLDEPCKYFLLNGGTFFVKKHGQNKGFGIPLILQFPLYAMDRCNIPEDPCMEYLPTLTPKVI